MTSIPASRARVQLAARSARAVANSVPASVRPAQWSSSAAFNSRSGPMRGSPRTAVRAMGCRSVLPCGPVARPLLSVLPEERRRQVFGLERDRSEPPSRARCPVALGRSARPYRCASAPDFEPDSLALGGRDRLQRESYLSSGGHPPDWFIRPWDKRKRIPGKRGPGTGEFVRSLDKRRAIGSDSRRTWPRVEPALL